MTQKFSQLVVSLFIALLLGGLVQVVLGGPVRAYPAAVAAQHAPLHVAASLGEAALLDGYNQPGSVLTETTNPSPPVSPVLPASPRLLSTTLQVEVSRRVTESQVRPIERGERREPLAERAISHTLKREPSRLEISGSQPVEARQPLTDLLHTEFRDAEGNLLRERVIVAPPGATYTTGSGKARVAGECVVASAADSGPGTLRQCMEAAVVGDTITFDPTTFPPNAPVTITLASALPWITTAELTIDGSEAGVVLDGGGLSNGYGLVIWGVNGVTIRGLQITHFPQDGIFIGNSATNAVIGGDRAAGAGPLGQGNLISGNGDTGVWLQDPGTTGNLIQGNFIGTDLAGTAALSNLRAGVVIGFAASNNVISGNLISGNADDGIHLQNAGTTGNLIQDNQIGTDLAGTTALGNLADGIVIIGGATNNTISSNLISGNGDSGIWLEGPGTTDNLIQDNTIGTDLSGTAALGNPRFGIFIGFAAADNIISGNLISSNESDGIYLQNAGTSGNLIQDNQIGTDLSGTVALGNLRFGVFIGAKASNNVTSGNLISGNGDSGVWLEGPGTSGNLIQDNQIGTNFSGTAALGNLRFGVIIGFAAADNIISGNLISGNEGDGIYLQNVGTTGNLIQDNQIGTNFSGTAALGNLRFGVFIGVKASNNVISGNLISGNGDSGVWLEGPGTSGNLIQSNHIGTDLAGTAALGNLADGVIISFAAANNIISGNLISGNKDSGIWLYSPGTTGNLIQDNQIGTDLTGTAPLGNLGDGVFISFAAANNIISGNLISGNEGDGIQLQDSGTIGNMIRDNYIGTDLTGTATLGNLGDGVIIGFGAANNIISGNLISGNEDNGSQLQDAGTTANLIQDNYIGTDLAGTAALGNLGVGVFIGFGAANNIISGNLISGNEESGVHLQNAGTTANLVQDNQIGTDLAGTAALGNLDFGVFIGGEASNNVISGNLISGNEVSGVHLQNAGTTTNLIQDNQIGANLGEGVFIGGEASNNVISGNLISGNETDGVILLDPGTSDNLIQGNQIGTDLAGTATLGNLDFGVFIGGEASNNVISGNLISDNGLFGVFIWGVGTSENWVVTNFIGTNISGTTALGNHRAGVGIGEEASNNIISDNLISGNKADGVILFDPGTSDNLIQSNRIGTDLSGTAALGNLGVGVGIGEEASSNIISDNLISGNKAHGVILFDPGTSDNLIQGNWIGTDLSGTAALGNLGVGVGIGEEASNNIISGNLISGNNYGGVQLQNPGTIGNLVQGNRIGTDLTGAALGNLRYGIIIVDGTANNLIGGTTITAGNSIAFNAVDGVYVGGDQTLRNTIRHNAIYHNGSAGIETIDGGNKDLAPPVILLLTYTRTRLSGQAQPEQVVEIFSDDERQGRWFEGETTTDAGGAFTITQAAGFRGPNLTATVTDADGNTSEFSTPFSIVDFTGRPRSGPRPLTVTFTSAVTGTTAEGYFWHFGEGLTATGAIVTHTYRMAGAYTVSLVVTDPLDQITLTKPDYIILRTVFLPIIRKDEN